MNLRCDDRFAEDEGWHRAAERYESFLRTRQGQKLLFLELGVGYNTPVIIKYPFWRMTAQNPQAFYVCINPGWDDPQRVIYRRQPPGGVCLPEPGPGRRPPGDSEAVHLHRREHRSCAGRSG